MKLLSTAHVDVGAAVIRSVFATARALFDPGAVVHLGAGTGQGPLHDWRQWPVPASLVLDAQPQRMAWAADWAAQGPERWVVDALVAGADGQAAKLHHASNPDESGLIPTKALQKLWPQLKALEATDIPTRSLDALLAEPAHAALLRAPNLWLVVDFFCTPEFWRGASATLAQARVVVLRQTKTAPKGIEPLQDTADRMAALGYALAATLDSTHPEVVHAVYLRRLDHDLATAHQQEQQLAAAFDGLVQEKAALAAARDAEASAKAEALKQRDALVQEKAALSAARDAEASAKAEALKQRDAEASAKAQALKECDALVQEKAVLAAARDAEASAKADALKRRDALVQEKAVLTAARDAEASAKAEALKQRDAEASAKAQALKERDGLVQEKAVLAAARDTEASAKAEALKQRDAEASAKAQALKERDGLVQEKTALAAARDAEASAKAEALKQRDAEATAKAQALKERDGLVHEKAALAAARDAEASAKAEALKQRDAEASAKAQALKQCDALDQEKTALAAARDTEASAKAEALKQRDAEASAKAKALKECDALVQEKAALSAARDAEASAKAEALKQRDAEASAKAQALKERDALVQDKTALAAARDAEASAKAEALKRLGQEIDANVLLAKKLEDEIKTSLTLRRVNTDLDTEKAKLQQELSTLISQYDVEVRAKQRALELSELGENNQAELLKKLSEESRQLAALFQEKTKLSEALAVSEEKSNAMEDQVKILEKALAAETHATANAISQRDRESKEKIEALKAKAHLVEVSEDRKQKIENARKEMQIILDDRNNIKEEMQLRLQNELEAQKKKDLEIRSEIERTVHILKVDNDALRTRQAMMHEELLRAEAQIELIKDLLIRGPGL